ncbi:MAG: hypothetical protein WCF83_27855, partial [Pseudolabrys sp.]
IRRLSPKFEKALVYATRVHGGQLRKKTRIPYIARIPGVTAIALEQGSKRGRSSLFTQAHERCSRVLG